MNLPHVKKKIRLFVSLLLSWKSSLYILIHFLFMYSLAVCLWLPFQFHGGIFQRRSENPVLQSFSIFFTLNKVEHLFLCIKAIYKSFSVNCLGFGLFFFF